MKVLIVSWLLATLLVSAPAVLAGESGASVEGRYIIPRGDNALVRVVILRPDGTFRIERRFGASAEGTWRLLAPNLVETIVESTESVSGKVVASLVGDSDVTHYDIRDADGHPLPTAIIDIECVDGSRFQVNYLPPVTSVSQCVPKRFVIMFPGMRAVEFQVDLTQANSFTVTLDPEFAWDRSMLWCVIKGRLHALAGYSMRRE